MFTLIYKRLRESRASAQVLRVESLYIALALKVTSTSHLY